VPGAWELRKLSCKLPLLNSHATLVLVWPGHESWEKSHANSRFSTLMQLLFSFDRGPGARELRKLSCKLSLLNSHATLVLVWPGHESWEKSHANSRFSTLVQLLFSFDRGTRVEKTLMQTLASQLSCNSCSRLTGAWELRKLSRKLSLLNSHSRLTRGL
jgi:hypothetical protein